MKVIANVLLIAAFGLAGTLPAYADSCHLRDRMERLERRIDHGVERGSLTDREVHWLKRERREIRGMARDFREDGHLSRRECAILADRVERLSDHISRLKHNDRHEDSYRRDDSYYRRH